MDKKKLLARYIALQHLIERTSQIAGIIRNFIYSQLLTSADNSGPLIFN